MPEPPRYADYAQLRQSVPIAGRIAESLLDSIYSGYTVSGTEGQKTAINSFFRRQQFDANFRQMVEDTVVFGDSYWEVAKSSPLKRIDPSLADSFSVVPSRQEGAKAGTLVLEAIVVGGRTVRSDNFLHFGHSLGSNGPFGASAYSQRFDDFRATQNATTLVNRGSPQAARDRDALEDKVLTGAGSVPSAVATRNLSNYSLPLTVGRTSPFAAEVQARQKELQDQVERKLFPLVLNASWSPHGWPEFRIRGNLRLG